METDAANREPACDLRFQLTPTQKAAMLKGTGRYAEFCAKLNGTPPYTLRFAMGVC
jgi:hypothetical protein